MHDVPSRLFIDAVLTDTRYIKWYSFTDAVLTDSWWMVIIIITIGNIIIINKIIVSFIKLFY